MKENDVNKLSSKEVRNNVQYKLVPEEEKWRIPMLKELIEVKAGNWKIEGFSNEELTEIVEFICVS